MKLIDRYIIKKSFFPLLYSILFFLLLVLIIDVFENLEAIIKNKVPFLLILKYYYYLMPNYLSQISSIAILFSAMYILGDLSKYNEITALRAMGINILRITVPFLFIGFFCSILIIILNETILPQCIFNHTFIKEKYIKSKDHNKNFYKKNIAILSGDYSYLVKKYDIENKEMHGITILKYSGLGDVESRIDAEKAKWTGIGWQFYNGSIRSFNKNREAKLESFSERFMSFLEHPEFFKKTITIDLMSFRDLYKHITRLRKNGYEPLRELVYLHGKVAFPFVNFIILLIGIPVVFLFSKTGMVLGVVVSLMISFCYKLAIVVGISLGNSGVLSPCLAAWSGNIIFFIIGMFMFWRIRL